MAIVPIDQLLFGIRSTESGGTRDPYRVVNSIGAHGAYQVMRANIGPWTKEVTGRAYTPAEFLASPDVQDKVAAFRLERDMKKYNSWESAAAVWFSGQPNPNSGASDGNATVRQYVESVRKAMAKWKPGATVPAAGGGAVQTGIIGDALTGGITAAMEGIGRGVGSLVTPIASVGKFAEFLMKLALPSTWVRITCGIGGLTLLLIGLVVLGREAKGPA